jgi:hypothetical protein
MDKFYIDGRIVGISDEQLDSARRQLDLNSTYQLARATQLLAHNSGNGLVIIPLPADLMVAIFEDGKGMRKYGVVNIKGLNER